MPWARHYRMYDYILSELPEVIEANFPIRTDKQGIMGHSMGGHGALVLGLRNPDRYRSISALAPLCSPKESPWGSHALVQFLGSDSRAWQDYDSTHLVTIAKDKRRTLFVDQGAVDEFLSHMRPDLLHEACAKAHYPLDLRVRENYDHGYYFVQSFIGEHIAHHARALQS